MALVPNKETKLFVGNLPSDITAEELQYVFNNYGIVTKSHVMDSSRSKSGQACAFVSYATPEAAAIAIQTLNNVYRIRADAKEAITVSVAKGSGQTEGSAIAAALVAAATGGVQVAMQPAVSALPDFTQPVLAQPGLIQPGLTQPVFFSAQPSLESAVAAAANQQAAAAQFQIAAAAQVAGGQLTMPAVAPPSLPCKLFIGDLPGDIAREALVAVFSTYGTVTDVHLMTGKSRSGAACALVEYSNMTEAQTAIATLHQKYEIRPGGGMITVRLFEGSKGKGKGASPMPAAPSFADPLAALGGVPAAPGFPAAPGLLMQPDPAGLRYTPY